MAIVAKRTVMTLYSDPMDPYSHQVRIVLAEKGVNVDIKNVRANEHNEDLMTINPYNSVPTLVDRDLILYEARIIMEYLDERFPHPPLLPVYPVARAEGRKLMYRIERDWYSLIKQIQTSKKADQVAEARKHLLESLISLEPIFADKPYFMSEEFSLIDCCISPILWRLSQYGIELPAKAKAIKQYAARVFARGSFQASLTEVEKELRAA
ncbi:MAG: stringent starvation protein A [Proteobacteria bacterium]|nr:stringent starvation protein A [Pseudomonadota bacterium]